MYFSLIIVYCLQLMTCLVNTNQFANSIEQNMSTISEHMFQFFNNNINSSSIDSIDDTNLVSNISLTDLQNDNNTQLLQQRYREKKRFERLQLIQTQILQRLGISGHNSNSSNTKVLSNEEKNLLNRVVQVSPTPRTRIDTVTGVNEISSSEIFSERLQSFYPSCTVPNHTDPLLWSLSSDSQMKLFFDITFPRSVDTHNEVSAVSAKLRIYKFNDPPNQWATATSYMGNTVTDRVSQVASQEGLTISVYQYMRPLRQNRREKKRLIDSRAVAWNKRSYIEFNIINAINYWQNNPNRNFGLFIEIEDPFGGRYNPELYITQMNCSVQNTPIPNLAQIYPEMDNESSLFNNDNFPTLDLLTIEIARQNSVSIVDTNRSTNFSNGKRKRDVNHKYMCRTIKRVISIKDLNLDDIILYPTTIEMAFCKGFCRTNQGNEYECKLTDYKDIEFIYLDSNSNPTIKTLKNFLPQSCQCVKRDTFD